MASQSAGEDVYAKALRAPSEITDTEKQLITHWPSDEVITANVRKVTGGTRDELVQKAVADANALTYPECRLLRDYYNIISHWDGLNMAHEKYDLPPQQWERRQAARRMLMSEDEFRAIENARQVFPIKDLEYKKPLLAAAQAVNDEPPPWVQRLLHEPQRRWGLMFYHTSEAHWSDEEWADFVRRWEAGLDEILAAGVIGGEAIAPRKIVEWSDLVLAESQGLDPIREHFRRLRDQGALKEGVLPNVFMLFDQESRASGDTREKPWRWAWAVDPDWTADGPVTDGYEGRARITFQQCYRKLYEFLSEKRFTIKDIWEETWKMEVEENLPAEPWFKTKLAEPKWPRI